MGFVDSGLFYFCKAFFFLQSLRTNTPTQHSDINILGKISYTLLIELISIYFLDEIVFVYIPSHACFSKGTQLRFNHSTI